MMLTTSAKKDRVARPLEKKHRQQPPAAATTKRGRKFRVNIMAFWHHVRCAVVPSCSPSSTHRWATDQGDHTDDMMSYYNDGQEPSSTNENCTSKSSTRTRIIDSSSNHNSSSGSFARHTFESGSLIMTLTTRSPPMREKQQEAAVVAKRSSRPVDLDTCSVWSQASSWSFVQDIKKHNLNHDSCSVQSAQETMSLCDGSVTTTGTEQTDDIRRSIYYAQKSPSLFRAGGSQRSLLWSQYAPLAKDGHNDGSPRRGGGSTSKIPDIVRQLDDNAKSALTAADSASSSIASDRTCESNEMNGIGSSSAASSTTCDSSMTSTVGNGISMYACSPLSSDNNTKPSVIIASNDRSHIMLSPFNDDVTSFAAEYILEEEEEEHAHQQGFDESKMEPPILYTSSRSPLFVNLPLYPCEEVSEEEEDDDDEAEGSATSKNVR